MKNKFYYGFILVLTFLVTGCTKESLSTEFTEELDASARKDAATADVYAVGGILFDLETAPNGDILVADALRGIVDLHGNLEASIPGATSVSTVGRGYMWATSGPREVGTSDERQRLYSVYRNRVEMVANLFEFEATFNPHDATIDSNPYAVAALDANTALVVDSGGNDLLRIDRKGNIEVVAIFPSELVSTGDIKSLVGCPNPEVQLCNLPPSMLAQAVPTSVVVGPDGYYYVGELKGFPAPTGESNIWKIAPDATGAMCGSNPDCAIAFDGGFTSIVDMVFGEDGRLYIAEMDVKSWFAVEEGLGEGGRIQACDPETLNCEVIATNIPMLTSIVFDKDGNLWATRNALIPGASEVVRIPL